MKSRSRYRRLAIAFVLLVGVFGGALLTPAAHAAAQAVSVLVANTTENPVPALIVGTPSVSVAGTPSVTIAGTPAVTIAADGREPVQGSKVLGDGDTMDCDELYVVPGGKRLVVEYVSVEGFGLTATNRVHVRLNAFGEGTAVNVPINPAFGSFQIGSETVQFFSTSDLHACVYLAQAQGSSNPTIDVSWTGHLENIQ